MAINTSKNTSNLQRRKPQHRIQNRHSSRQLDNTGTQISNPNRPHTRSTTTNLPAPIKQMARTTTKLQCPSNETRHKKNSKRMRIHRKAYVFPKNAILITLHIQAQLD